MYKYFNKVLWCAKTLEDADPKVNNLYLVISSLSKYTKGNMN